MRLFFVLRKVSYLDARYEKVRDEGIVKDLIGAIAMEIHEDGYLELLYVDGGN